MEKKNNILTGKASIDRPWMKYYPESLRDIQVPECGLMDYVKQNVPDDLNRPAMHYYGTDLTWDYIFNQVDLTAKSLKAIGIEEGECIPVFLQSVPQFIVLLLAADKIGASLLCRDGDLEENIAAIKGSKSSILFAHDYISKEEEERYLAETDLKRIITLSPYTWADKSQMPDYICEAILARYPEKTACNPQNLTWEQFLDLGKNYMGEWEVASNPFRPLFSAYTSGSTAASKMVIHSANSMIGILHQMAVYAGAIEFSLSWIHTILPPALVAVTVTMLLSPLTSNKFLILDPFCDIEDLDLEFMRYKPNIWPLIPGFMEVLLKSRRIPKDFSMEFFFSGGAGAEGPNNKQIHRMQEFLKEHKSPAVFSVGYGQSEAGSGLCMNMPTISVEDGFCGIPMHIANVGIFEHKTDRELGYGEIGEICKTGAGNMLGYDDPEETAKVMIRHSDGNLWLHTGDFGYITEEGGLYVLSRGLQERFGGGYMLLLPMENKVVEIAGIWDGFFVNVPDKEHEGYFLPYLYVVLEEGVDLEDVRGAINDALEPHERPVQITVIKERPYFHFKTDRRGLTAEILEERL